MTSIEPRDPDLWIVGLADWGLKTRAEMLGRWRRYYERQAADAARALAMADEELVVETYLGPHARRSRREIT